MIEPHTVTDELFSVGQIRLAELSVFNWGSFNGLHSARIDPMGTLITGDNGAGKSTFIDGLMALLLPAGKASFNMAAAQGDRSDRTLLSYMRGSFGSAHDGAGTRVRSKREAAVVSGLRALYRGDDGHLFTLAALFWTTQSSNALADVKRVYAVAKRNLTLKEMLDAFGEGNARALKQWLRDDPSITCCDDSFGDYQELYRKLLHMDNKNAPALLSRALGLKKIDDLTGLIRELVLEPSGVKEDAKTVVDEFADLVAIHTQLEDARAQRDHLAKLPELSAAIAAASRELEQLSAEKDGLPAYFGEVGAQFWRAETQAIAARLDALAARIRQYEAQEQDAHQRVERMHEEYLQLGGDKIEALKKEIGHTQDRLDRVIRESSRYQENARALDLATTLTETTFHDNQSIATAKLANIASDNAQYQDRFASVSAKYSECQANLKDVCQEIRETEARPDSNIRGGFQKLRDELVNSLGLTKERCVFIGELIDVKESERHWQGAIERALGGLRTTLAVPEDVYPMVTRWLNARHTGLHVRVQVLREAARQGRAPEFKRHGYLTKLVWREHAYRDWLKHHLQKFDLSCVDDTTELDRTAFSMTQQGLIHFDKGRFEKKDRHRVDDRAEWCLGFSNKSRLGILARQKHELSVALAAQEKQVTQARRDLDAIGNQKIHWQKLQTYQWDDVNAPYWRGRLATLQADLQQLAQAGGDVAQAKSRWEAAKAELASISADLKDVIAERGGVEHALSSARAELEKAQAAAAKGLADAMRQRLRTRVGALSTEDNKQLPQVMSQVEKNLDKALDLSRNRKNSAERSAVGIMSSFRSNDKWQAFTVDWQSDVGSLKDYLAHLEQLEKEGLPTLVERFVERLNKHATQSLARIKTKLESEREDIIERIEIINRVLKRTEFRAGSHLRLGFKKEKYPHVQEFEQQLRKVLSQVTSDDHEGRFRQLATVVAILAKASTPGTANTLESLRLLDPRYQMSFYAEERDARTGEVRDVLESSSGKSGGEKESFAGTVVAASLAYVLTPDGHDRPVYCTVFLDEAFSNTAEAVSRRVLRVFKALHIHVNLITPYKNLNLARESARSLLIAERDAAQHDSHLCEVTWEEIDEKMAQQRAERLALQAANLGLQIDAAAEASSNA